MDSFLRIVIIVMPLTGILIVGLIGEKHVQAQRRVTVIFLANIALAALALFLTSKYYACTLSTGFGNCIEESLITLLLFAGSLGLSFKYQIADRMERPGRSKSYISALLFIGAPAVLLFNNLLLWLIAWYVFSYVIYRSLRRSGLHWGFFMIHDDYRDDAVTRRN